MAGRKNDKITNLLFGQIWDTNLNFMEILSHQKLKQLLFIQFMKGPVFAFDLQTPSFILQCRFESCVGGNKGNGFDLFHLETGSR